MDIYSHCHHFVYLQTRAQLEKTKSLLEAENQDMVNEMKQIQMAKQESERKRKQAEQQVAEITIRLQELERLKGDQGDKLSRQQNEVETLSAQLEQAETKSIQLGQKNASLEAQLADAQVCPIILVLKTNLNHCPLQFDWIKWNVLIFS